MTKWVTIGKRFSRKSVTEGYRNWVNVGVKEYNGLRVNILHLKLSYGVTVSEGKRVNLFQKMGYHIGVMVRKVLRLTHLVTILDYGE